MFDGILIIDGWCKLLVLYNDMVFDCFYEVK